MTNKKTFVVLALCVALILVIVAAAYLFDRAQIDSGEGLGSEGEIETPGTEVVELPELKILSSDENDNGVVVSTTYGNFRYPYAFSDIMSVEAENQENSSQLKFSVQMNDSSELIFVIHYNDNIGDLFGTLNLGEHEIPVSVEFVKPSELIQSDFLDAFYATQETFNDVYSSMSENSNFTSAK